MMGAFVGTAPFLEAASRIGRRLVRQARWDGDQCTWIVMVPDPARRAERVAKGEIAGAGLYQGTAGIGLFLAELACVGGDPDVRRTAIGALRHAVRRARDVGVSAISLHGGRIGIAWSAARVGAIVGTEALTAAARDLLADVAGAERDDRVHDVIGGAAGAIPALLQLATWLEADHLVDIAKEYGRHLIRSARLEPVGWSWGGSTSAAVRNLTGYAHGASGIGHAFTELYHHCGLSEFRYAAQQALLYERQFFDPTEANWPDLRNAALSRYGYEGRMPELVERLRRGGNPAPFRVSYMTAWCHGAPGIGNSRLRAYQVFGDAVYRDELTVAVGSTARSLSESWANYSLCHGIAGNCETLVLASEALAEPGLRETAEDLMSAGIERFGRRDVAWPGGTTQAAPDPSLMLGEAGIGHLLLRLHDGRVPSVLLPASPRESPAPETGREGEAAARHRYVTAYLGRTLAALEGLGGTSAVMNPPTADGLSEIQHAFEQLRRAADREPDPRRRRLLADAAVLDEAAFALACAITDFTAPRLRMLARPPDATTVPSDLPLALTPDARVVAVAHDWETWLAQPPARRPAAPATRRVRYLVFRSHNRVTLRRLQGFSDRVLRAFRDPTTLAEAVRRVSASWVPDGGVAWAEVERRVRGQVQELYDVGIVECVRSHADRVHSESSRDSPKGGWIRSVSRTLSQAAAFPKGANS
jgi:hypothetical protein